MKKGFFLPMLVGIIFIVVGMLGLVFYENVMKSKTDIVGEKAGEVINSITEAELNNFYVEDAARLSWCNAMGSLAEDTGVSCFDSNDYPLWDTAITPKEPLCDPFNYQENFKAYFELYFNEYLSQKDLNFDYDLEINPDGFIVKSSSNFIFDKQLDKLEIYYDFNPEINVKIQNNLDDYNKLINCLGDDACLRNLGAKSVSSGADVKTYEYGSATNPCTSEKIKIKFGFAKDISKHFKLTVPIIHRSTILKSSLDNPGITVETLAATIYQNTGFDPDKTDEEQIKEIAEKLGASGQEYDDTGLSLAEIFSSPKIIFDACYKEGKFLLYEECKNNLDKTITESVSTAQSNSKEFKLKIPEVKISSQTSKICSDPNTIPIGSDGEKDEIVIFKGPKGCENKNKISGSKRTENPYCLKLYYCVDGKLADLGFNYDWDKPNQGNYWAHTGQGKTSSPTPTPKSKRKEFFTIHYLFQCKDCEKFGDINNIAKTYKTFWSKCKKGPYSDNRVSTNSRWEYKGKPRHPFHCYAWTGAAYFHGGYMIHGMAFNRPWVGTRSGKGCVELYDEDMLKLYPYLDEGDPVFIYDSFK